MIDLDDLKAKALAATPGPWERGDSASNGDQFQVYGEELAGAAICGMDSQYNFTPIKRRIENLDFIAAANPAAVLDLISELEKSKERIAYLESAWHAQTLIDKDNVIARQEEENNRLKALIADYEKIINAECERMERPTHYHPVGAAVVTDAMLKAADDAMLDRPTQGFERLDTLRIGLQAALELAEISGQRLANAERLGKTVLNAKNHWADRAIKAEQALKDRVSKLDLKAGDILQVKVRSENYPNYWLGGAGFKQLREILPAGVQCLIHPEGADISKMEEAAIRRAWESMLLPVDASQTKTDWMNHEPPCPSSLHDQLADIERSRVRSAEDAVIADLDRKLDRNRCKHGVILYGNRCISCEREGGES